MLNFFSPRYEVQPVLAEHIIAHTHIEEHTLDYFCTNPCPK